MKTTEEIQALELELDQYMTKKWEVAKPHLITLGVLRPDGFVASNARELYAVVQSNWQLNFWRAKALGEI